MANSWRIPEEICLIRGVCVFRPNPVTESPNPPEFAQPVGFTTHKPRAFPQCRPVPRSPWLPAPPALPLPTLRHRHPARTPLIRLVAALYLASISEELPGVPRSNKAYPSQILASNTAAPGYPSASAAWQDRGGVVEWPGGISHLPSITYAAVAAATEAGRVSEARVPLSDQPWPGLGGPKSTGFHENPFLRREQTSRNHSYLSSAAKSSCSRCLSPVSAARLFSSSSLEQTVQVLIVLGGFSKPHALRGGS